LKKVGGSGEPPPVRYLRKYSNYLTPRLGLLSADAWTLESTYSRNLALNLLIVTLSLAGSLLIPRVALTLLQMCRSLPGPALLLTSFMLSILSVSVVAFNFASMSDVRNALRRKIFKDQPGVQFFVVIPVFLASILMSVWVSISPAVRATRMTKMREEKTRSLKDIGGASLVLLVTGALGRTLV
jgi:hypothetical protein